MDRKKHTLIVLLAVFIVCISSAGYTAQTQISGDYCYQYGDSESLMIAKEISYAMALRKAIETYKTFVASTSVVKDFKLRKDLVETIASGYVENVQIIKQDVRGRTVCTELIGTVNPDAVKSIIARKVEKVHKTKRTESQGLLSNKLIKILNYKKTYCRISKYTEKYPCVKILYQAKQTVSRHSIYIIADCYDRDGNQIAGGRVQVPSDILHKGEVRETDARLPDETVSFELRLK